MPPPSSPEHRALFFLRRVDGQVSGPHEKAVIVRMLAAGELTGAEQVAIDRRSWKPLALLVGADAPAPPHPAAASPPLAAARRPAPAAAPGPPRPAAQPAPPPGARPAFVDLPASLDLGVEPEDGAMEEAGPPAMVSLEPAERESRPPFQTSTPAGETPGAPPGDEDPLGGLSLELVERKPARRPAPPPAAAPQPDVGAARPAAPPGRAAPVPPRAAPSRVPGPQAAGAELSAVPVTISLSTSSRVVQAALEADEAGAEAAPDPTLPVSIEAAAEPRKPARPRTITAARPGGPLSPKPAAPRRWRRLALPAAIAAALGAAIVVALALDLPARLRPEPDIAAVLGPLGADVARDRFPAYGEAARRLEDAVAARRRAPRDRAQAALLLASSVVIHGGERGRLTHADALLPDGAAPAEPAVTRARAWLALGKGRWKDTLAVADDPALAAGDRAMLRGWAALGRDEPKVAEAAFAEAVNATPPPEPSRVAARFGLALAREANLAPAAADAYRAVLAEAPAHVGAALGLLRLTPLQPAGRLKLARTLIASRARDASRAELAEAHVRAAEAMDAAGDAAGAEAERLKARQADPTSATLAVARGDQALREGRHDEALDDYKVALAAAPATPRTPALQFARVGAWLAGGRLQDAAGALARLEQGLPGDPRPPYWRGQLAERGPTPDLAAAERAYEEALRRDATFVPASLELARLRLGQHRPADALAVLKRAEAKGAAPVALRIALGEALLAAGNPTDAVPVFRQAVADDPGNVAARLGLASALYGSGNAGAAGAEVTALAARPDSATLGARLGSRLGDRIGDMLVKLGRRDEALAFYRKEIAAGTAAPSTKVAAARLALARGDRDEAQKLAEAAAAEDPRTPGALFVVGEALRAKGDLAGAVTELRRAQAVDGSPDVQLEYGRVLASLGRDEEALAALAEAGDLPEAHVERGRIDLRRGDADKAVDELTAATAGLPGSAEAFLLLGQAEDRLGHAEKAEAALKTATRLAPSLAEAQYRLGRLLLDRGAVAAAVPHLRAATEHAPPSAPWRADAFFQLGFGEQRQGNRERSVAALRRYLELAPSDAPARSEALKQLGPAPR